MAKDQSSESHLSQGGQHQPPGPTRQKHQLATGKKLDGMKNPYGPCDYTDKVGNQSKKY
jgi:hypothetical protein